MEADSQLQRNARQVTNFEVAALMEQVEGHRRYLLGMVGPGVGQAADYHISVADRLHLVDVVVAHDGGVEAGVEVVEQVYHLDWRAVRGYCGEADNVWSEEKEKSLIGGTFPRHVVALPEK